VHRTELPCFTSSLFLAILIHFVKLLETAPFVLHARLLYVTHGSVALSERMCLHTEARPHLSLSHLPVVGRVFPELKAKFHY